VGSIIDGEEREKRSADLQVERSIVSHLRLNRTEQETTCDADPLPFGSIMLLFWERALYSPSFLNCGALST